MNRRQNRQAGRGTAAAGAARGRAQVQTPAQRPQAVPPLVTPVNAAAEARASPLGALADDEEDEDGDYDGQEVPDSPDVDDSSSEYDTGATRFPATARRSNTGAAAAAENDDDDDDESTSHDGRFVEERDEAREGAAEFDDDDMLEDMGEKTRGQAQPFDAAARGLKEISNLGKFTVSSSKQGNGVEELRSDDLKMFWQSDGPQPHKLTIYFIKRVGIREICFYVDALEDESYTPTKMVFMSGTGENNLIKFATMSLDSPSGWQRVPVEGAGGGADGNTLFSYVLQIQILENHQNGKDTHLRGIKIYALDQEAAAAAEGQTSTEAVEADGQSVGQRELDDLLTRIDRELASVDWTARDSTTGIPDFFRDPEIR